MEYLQSCRTSIYEVIAFTAVHVRVYRRQGHPGEPRSAVERSLALARLHLNEHGVFAAVDVNMGKLLVFARTRLELEDLLKPFHRLVGAKITLACGNDLVFDFVDQRDVSLREVLPGSQNEQGDIAHQVSPGWQRFRSTIVTAVQDFVLSHIRRSCEVVQLDRYSFVLFETGAFDASNLSSTPYASQSRLHLLTVNADFVMSGKVLVYLRTVPIIALHAAGRTGLDEAPNVNVVLIPSQFRGTVCSRNRSLKGSTSARLRCLVSEWFSRKLVQCPEVASETGWIDVVVDAENTSPAGETVYRNSTAPICIPWPQRCVLVSKEDDSHSSPEKIHSFLSNEPDIFRLAIEMRDSWPRGNATATISREESFEYPEIPAEVRHDLPGASAISSPDTIMRDAATEAQQAALYPTPSDGLASHQTPASFAQDSPFAVSSQNQEQQTTAGATENPEPGGEARSITSLTRDRQQQKNDDSSRSPKPRIVSDDESDFFDEPKKEFHVAQRHKHVGSSPENPSKLPALGQTSSADELDDEKIAEEASKNRAAHDRSTTDSDNAMDYTMELAAPTPKSTSAQAWRNSSQQNAVARSSRIEKLNLKYAESGAFHAAPDKKTLYPLKGSRSPSQQVPRVGLPSDSSSDVETDVSESSSDAASPIDGSTSECHESTRVNGASDSIDPVSNDDEAVRKVKELLEAQTHAQDSSVASLFSSKAADATWQRSQWLFDGLGSDECIDIVQDLVKHIVPARASQKHDAEPSLPLSRLQKVTSETHQLDLLALALPSRDSKTMPSASLPELSPKSKRKEQEVRAQLRQALGQIEAPHVRVQRHGVIYSMLPTAVQFSESLGLSPVSGPKNVTIFCVSPLQRGSTEGIGLFHDIMEDAYISRQLGTYRRGQIDGEGAAAGHVPVLKLAQSSSFEDTGMQYNQACEVLGAKLASSTYKEASVVVFLVDVCNTQLSSLALSTSFHRLMQLVKSSCPSCTRIGVSEGRCHSDIQSIIIPSSYVNNDISVSLPALSPSNRHQLACQVYNSVGQVIADSGPFEHLIDTNPAIELDIDLPASIPFELSSQPPQHLFEQDTWLHVAYTFHRPKNWLVACWTDSAGRYQAHRTYPLKHLQLSTIFEEIWQSTLAVLQNEVGRAIRWRVCLAKVGCFQADEIKTWAEVIRDQPHDVSIYLLAVEPQPKFTIDITDIPSRTSHATPKAFVADNFRSPAASTPTPASDATASEADHNARLVDITDQTWSLFLSFQPNTADSPSIYLPSLLSALLIKRRSERDTDPPVVMQVNLMKVMLGLQQQKRGAPGLKDVMQQVLKTYAGLGLLARLRGLEGKESVRPLHVGYVESAVEGLEEMLEL